MPGNVSEYCLLSGMSVNILMDRKMLLIAMIKLITVLHLSYLLLGKEVKLYV